MLCIRMLSIRPVGLVECVRMEEIANYLINATIIITIIMQCYFNIYIKVH